MFRNALEEVDSFIKSNVFTLSGNDLYNLKKDFYDKSVEFMGHSNNLTGITELVVNMYLNHWVEAQSLPYTLKRNYKVKGVNGKENELDIAFLDKSLEIQYGISVKREIGSTRWETHEKSSTSYKELTKKYSVRNNLLQDYWRLDNIKRGISRALPTVTIIFEGVKVGEETMIKKLTEDTPSFQYLVLYQHQEAIFYDLKKKLCIL
ncbi:hypothetical protein [Evansella cellulosilytica]|uniref:Uncharacterized protein n=1 Tax=Evansella cellulosilytica (strain ATCC 21833 / DSM 2522 / FERM P-1141 / JCM 9156 / N-4) TaxID=649639 RepID=E6TU49_EVAC2|nr:hypothetical protein [Evansella cellulosilytica]ADU28509.1 hypothetical protein Bcell_0221 [Evansella cellulosilytica DSM 2522]